MVNDSKVATLQDEGDLRQAHQMLVLQAHSMLDSGDPTSIIRAVLDYSHGDLILLLARSLGMIAMGERRGE